MQIWMNEHACSSQVIETLVCNFFRSLRFWLFLHHQVLIFSSDQLDILKMGHVDDGRRREQNQGLNISNYYGLSYYVIIINTIKMYSYEMMYSA